MESSANIFSIVETAKANKIVSEKIFVYLFDNLLKIDISDSESLDRLIPWSDQLPHYLKLKDKK